MFNLTSLVNEFESCPFCDSKDIKKNGHSHSHQRYYCKHCHKSFTSRTNTILNSSKLKPRQLKLILSLLLDQTLISIVAHQAHVSIQTAVLWKRKIQKLTKSKEKIKLSGTVYVDETFINVPVDQRSKVKKRGLSKNKLQIAVAVDNNGHCFATVNGRGRASNKDSEHIFTDIVESGSVVYHDMGYYGKAFNHCVEHIINSSEAKTHDTLNPINRFCNEVQRIFTVHLRIRPYHIQDYLDELCFRHHNGYQNFDKYKSFVYEKIFTSSICLKRKDLCRK